jgi:hypothetical protein
MTDAVKQKNELRAEKFDSRLRALINTVLGGRPDWKRLEELTGVPAVRWRHHSANLKKPSVEMVAAICETWPQYALWLTTGVSDEDAGHRAPREAFFPGKLRQEPPLTEETNASTEYLRTCVKTREKLEQIKQEPQLSTEVIFEDEEATGRGLGAWLQEAVTGPRKREITEIAEPLLRLQQRHRAETIARIRRYNDDADSIIDQQRAEERRIKKKLGLDD